MKNLVNAIKGLFNIEEPLKDPNRSINYYRPDWVEPEEEAADYKKWKDYISQLYTFDALKDFPAEYEFNNITDPYLAKKADTRAAAVTKGLVHNTDESPRVEWNIDLKPRPELVEHEKFHAMAKEPNYFSDWNPILTRGFESAPEFIGGLLRKAHRASAIGGSKDAALARQFVNSAKIQQASSGPFSNADRLYAVEELGANMYDEGWHKKAKPYWMSDRDYQIMMNMISSRMGW